MRIKDKWPRVDRILLQLRCYRSNKLLPEKKGGGGVWVTSLLNFVYATASGVCILHAAMIHMPVLQICPVGHSWQKSKVSFRCIFVSILEMENIIETSKQSVHRFDPLSFSIFPYQHLLLLTRTISMPYWFACEFFILVLVFNLDQETEICFTVMFWSVWKWKCFRNSDYQADLMKFLKSISCLWNKTLQMIIKHPWKIRCGYVFFFLEKLRGDRSQAILLGFSSPQCKTRRSSFFAKLIISKHISNVYFVSFLFVWCCNWR